MNSLPKSCSHYGIDANSYWFTITCLFLTHFGAGEDWKKSFDPLGLDSWDIVSWFWGSWEINMGYQKHSKCPKHRAFFPGPGMYILKLILILPFFRLKKMYIFQILEWVFLYLCTVINLWGFSVNNIGFVIVVIN